MKGKKLLLLGLSLGLVGALSSCGGLNEEDSKKVIERAFQMNVVTTSKGTIVTPELAVDLAAASNDALVLTTKQVTKVDGKNYDVEFEYTWDADAYGKRVKSYEDKADDVTHKELIFYFPYQSEGRAEFKFKGTGKLGNYTVEKEYTVNLVPSTIIMDDLTLAQLFAKNTAGDAFIFSKSDGSLLKNHDNSFYYITTRGKLVYLAPDHDWGLLSDGDKTLELYKVKELAGHESLEVGEYYEVDGNMAQYKGNPQLSFITRMDKLSDHSAITEPADLAFTADNKPSTIAFLDGSFNRVATVTGATYKTAIPSDATTTGRWTFKVNLGGEEVEVAYDYHVGKEGGQATAQGYIDALKAATVGSSTINLHGTIRWVSDDEKFHAPGHWSIVPFGTDGVVVA